MGLTAHDIALIDRSLEVKDATADQMKEAHPEIQIIYGDREGFIEKRFPFLRRRRERY